MAQSSQSQALVCSPLRLSALPEPVSGASSKAPHRALSDAIPLSCWHTRIPLFPPSSSSLFSSFFLSFLFPSPSVSVRWTPPSTFYSGILEVLCSNISRFVSAVPLRILLAVVSERLQFHISSSIFQRTTRTLSQWGMLRSPPFFSYSDRFRQQKNPFKTEN